MTSDGHAYGRFKPALINGHLLQAMAEARDIPHVPLADALVLCLLMDEHDDDPHERAAADYPVEVEASSMRLGSVRREVEDL